MEPRHNPYNIGGYNYEAWSDDESSEDECEGILRIENCCSHKHVEWESPYEQSGDHLPRKTSRPFKVEGDNCWFNLFYSRDYIEVKLRRTKWHCGRDDLRCWIGIKLANGPLDLQMMMCRDLIKCTTESCLFPRSELEKNLRNPDGNIVGNIVVFLRFNVERGRKKVRGCKHGVFDLAVPSDGSIREEECYSHKYVEWNCSYRYLEQNATSTSPAFRVGRQAYLIHLTCTADYISAILYRMGPSDCLTLPWCAGFKLGDGTYSHRPMSGKIGLYCSYELWEKNAVLCQKFPRSILERKHLAHNRWLTFFFRINVKPNEFVEESCIHYTQDVYTLAAGSIVEEEQASSFKKVEWTVDYKQEYETGVLRSPVFVVNKQRYLLELTWTDTEKVTLSLYRMKPPAAGSRRWWVGVSTDGHHFGSECRTFDEEQHDSWIHETVLVFRHKAGRMRLKVDFVMAVDERWSPEIFHYYGRDPHCITPFYGQLVVFKVKHKVFAFSKAVLSIRCPVFETFFLHDSLESRTGIVHIEDCEPSIFKAFLKYAADGNSRTATVYEVIFNKFDIYSKTVTAVTDSNAVDLYVIADKYLFENLRAECSDYIARSLCPDTITDAICLALRYDDERLLKSTIEFMRRRGTSLGTEVWENFCAENPDIANDARLNAYESFEIYKEELKRPKVPLKPIQNSSSRDFLIENSIPPDFSIENSFPPDFSIVNRFSRNFSIRNWLFRIFTGWLLDDMLYWPQ